MSMNNYELTLDFSKAEAIENGFKFDFDVYASVHNATSGFAQNVGSVLFSPISAIKNNGYYRVTVVNDKSYYVSPSDPTVLTTVQPS